MRPILNQQVDTCNQVPKNVGVDTRTRCGRKAVYVIDYAAGVPTCRLHLAAALDFVLIDRDPIEVYTVREWKEMIDQERNN